MQTLKKIYKSFLQTASFAGFQTKNNRWIFCGTISNIYQSLIEEHPRMFL